MITLEKICIGKIVNTHGLKGELKILSETDFKSARYRPGQPLFIACGEEYVKVKLLKFRPHQGFDLLTFADMEDINLVEKYRGCALYSEDHPITDLAPNEFQTHQLLKMNVLQNGRIVGVVSGIRVYPQGDYLEVTKPDQTVALIPFRDEFVLAIDEPRKTLTIIEMEGLL